MSSNLILNDEMIEKTTNKKIYKIKGVAKKKIKRMGLKSDRKKPIKDGF
jgi:hypothetical protein